ncbi:MULTISPECIES: PRTRC system protein F [unclassified Paraburkholderia]|uniref:PRTRC system protein F n=1 Tax=unclassified Paraburkholderia TaxID=2615204 RepID=UPI002AB1C09A|nr:MULTISPECIES: PRTRC system protein F [unclassified Paraburkholderia]
MLFDPSSVDRSFDAGAGEAWQPAGVAAPRHRAAASVLTLPDFADAVPREATIRWRPDTQLDALVLEQFRHAPLRAADVETPCSPVDAFQQAFFAWVRRQMSQPLSFISMGLQLCDTNAVLDAIDHQHEAKEFKPGSGLHLGIRLTDEWMHEVGALAESLRQAHPLLLHTLFAIVDRVSGKTVLIRTPAWYLSETAARYWDYNESATDEQAGEWLAEWYENDQEAIANHLPSVIRPQVYPDEVRCPAKLPGRRVRSSELSDRELATLLASSTGLIANVCRELLALRSLLKKAGDRLLLGGGHDANALYSGCSFVLERTEWVVDVIDTHLNDGYQTGENSEFATFLTFSNTKQGIRAQYAQWGLAFQMLRRVDRLMALVVSP